MLNEVRTVCYEKERYKSMLPNLKLYATIWKQTMIKQLHWMS